MASSTSKNLYNFLKKTYRKLPGGWEPIINIMFVYLGLRPAFLYESPLSKSDSMHTFDVLEKKYGLVVNETKQPLGPSPRVFIINKKMITKLGLTVNLETLMSDEKYIDDITIGNILGIKCPNDISENYSQFSKVHKRLTKRYIFKYVSYTTSGGSLDNETELFVYVCYNLKNATHEKAIRDLRMYRKIISEVTGGEIQIGLKYEIQIV
jgi:hypothetical protein